MNRQTSTQPCNELKHIWPLAEPVQQAFRETLYLTWLGKSPLRDVAASTASTRDIPQTFELGRVGARDNAVDLRHQLLVALSHVDSRGVGRVATFVGRSRGWRL